MSFSEREPWAWKWPSTEVPSPRAASVQTAEDYARTWGVPKRKKRPCQATIRVREIDRRRNEGRKLSDAQKDYIAILDRGDADECYLCECVLNDGNRTIEHVVPKARGGGEALTNKKLACVSCNVKKGDTPLPEYLARKRVA